MLKIDIPFVVLSSISKPDCSIRIESIHYGLNKIQLAMIITEFADRGLISPPKWLLTNCCYLTYMGSRAYGTATEGSDYDVFGFCVPKLDSIFPHLAGDIPGFGTRRAVFEQWSEHHVVDAAAGVGREKEYDFTILGIIKFFNLAMQNNPGCIDALFVPANCIVHTSKVGLLVRENRKMFLHKGSYPRLKGYSFQQLHKMTIKNPIGKRREDIEKNGFDSKFGMHVVRLLDQCEQILMYGDLDLQRNREHLKAIRRGEISEAEIRRWASEKELQLEKLYAESTAVPDSADEPKIRRLLLSCLEMQYGSLDKVIHKPSHSDESLLEIKNVLERHGIR